MGPRYYSLKAGIVLLALATAGINSGLETTRVSQQIGELHHNVFVMAEAISCHALGLVAAGMVHAKQLVS